MVNDGVVSKMSSTAEQDHDTETNNEKEVVDDEQNM